MLRLLLGTATLSIRPSHSRSSARQSRRCTQHAARLPKLASAIPEQCRAFCGTVENSAGVKLRVWCIFCSSPAAFAGRLDWVPTPKAIQPSGQKPDSISEHRLPRGCTTGLFLALPQKALHCSRRCSLPRS